MFSVVIALCVTANTHLDAKAIFIKGEEKLKAAKSLSGRTEMGTFVLAKPFRYLIDDGFTRSYCDGKVTYAVFPARNEYRKTSGVRELPSDYPVGIEAFFGVPIGSSDLKPRSAASPKMKSIRYAIRTFEGRQVSSKSFVIDLGSAQFSIESFVDAKSFNLVGARVELKTPEQTRSRLIHFQQLKYNPKVAPTAFQWKPVPGMKEIKIRSTGQ